MTDAGLSQAFHHGLGTLPELALVARKSARAAARMLWSSTALGSLTASAR
jgi:hypothetical protein